MRPNSKEFNKRLSESCIARKVVPKTNYFPRLDLRLSKPKTIKHVINGANVINVPSGKHFMFTMFNLFIYLNRKTAAST